MSKSKYAIVTKYSTDDPDFKQLCGGKKKIAMFELSVYIGKYMDLVD